MPKSKLKNDIKYGYYIDEDGLYFKSEKNGEILECFDINGVASVSLQFGEIDILHLCYITNEDDELDDDF
jgi:hypothetical protein